MNTKAKLQGEIREANLSYLMLAQTLLKEDRASALLQLGLNDEIAQIVEQLSPSQLIRLAQTNLLMCRMRFSDGMIWSLLSDRGAHQPGSDSSAARLHASILMAGQLEDAL